MKELTGPTISIQIKMQNLRTPNKKVSNGPKGGFKQLVAKDERYVALKGIMQQFDPTYERNRRPILAALSQYRSDVQARVVERNLMLAQNGGREVHTEMVKKGKTLNISQYRQALCRYG